MDNLLNIELLKDNLNNIMNYNFKLIYYHINREAIYPFMQILLSNYISPFSLFGLNEQKFVFPTMLYDKNMDINKYIYDYLINRLESIETNEINNININGFHIYNWEIYIFIDMSSINLDRLLLSKNSEVWFALITELVNTKHICNITISQEVSNFITNNINLFSKIDNTLFPSPEVIYTGNHFSKVEFQSLFGISKSEREYGNYFYFSYSLEESLYDGVYSKNGTYIEGGINRVAILLDKSKYIKEDEVNDLINKDIWEEYILDYDCIFILLKTDKILILMKDYNRQYPLSYHIINKKTINTKKIDIV